MDASLHANGRTILTSADLLGIVKAATVRIEFRGEPDRRFNPVGDKVAIFVEGRAEALQVAQGLRDAAAKLEACYPLTVENATLQERLESVHREYESMMAAEAEIAAMNSVKRTLVEPAPEPAPARRERCTRCNVSFDRPDGTTYHDGNPRCEECESAHQDALDAAERAEGHPCHREDQ